jgi:branched-chain amino acid transport system substrate-binding protein
MTRNAHRPRRLGVAAVGVALAIVAAACGSSNKSSTSSTTTSSTSSSSSSAASSSSSSSSGLVTNIGNGGGGPLAALANSSTPSGPVGTGLTRGITATSVTVGCVYTADSYSGYQAGIQARFNAVNTSGGIDGRKLTLLPCKDDANSPQTNLEEVQELVNQDSVFAVFSLTQDILAGSTDFLNSNQVPFYGWGFLPGFCGTRWGFGWNGCLGGNALPKSEVPHEAIGGSLAEPIIKASGLSDSQVRLAVQSENTESGQVGAAQYSDLFQALGSKVVYNKADFPTTGTPDVTPYVQAIIASNPNIVYLSTPFNDVGPLAAGLKAAGYKGITMDFTNYIPGLLQASPQLAAALQGEYINTQIVPQEENTPFIQQIQSSLKAIGQQPFVTLGAEMGYIEAELLVEQLQAVGKNLNTKTFDQTVNGGKFTSFATLQGGPGKLEWPAGHLLPADCAAIVKVSGTSFNVVEPFACYQSFKVF